MDAKGAIQQEITSLKKQLKAHEDALRALRKGESAAGVAALRFYEWRPIDAICEVLREEGRKMTRKELHDVLAAGGISVGKKRAAANVRISINTNVGNGNLVEFPGEYIGLPEKDRN